MPIYTSTTIEELTKRWPSNDWTKPLTDLEKSTEGSFDDSAVKIVCNQLSTSIEQGLGSQIRDWCALSIRLAPEQMLRTTRFLEAIRPSRYSRNSLKKLSWALARVERLLAPLQPESSKHVRSWICCIALWERSRADEQRLVERLTQKLHLIPNLLVIIEEAFAGVRRENAVTASISAEELASACSFLLAIFDDAVGLKANDLKISETGSGDEDTAHNLLLGAHCLRGVRDVEVLIMRFGHHATMEGQEIQVTPSSDAMGMALSHGYLRTEFQAAVRANGKDLYTQDTMRFIDFCTSLEQRVAKETTFRIFEIAEKPHRRLRVRMTDVAARLIAEQVLNAETYFQEDIQQLADACYELHATLDELLALKITDSLNLGSIFRITRTFRFYSVLRAAELARMREIKEPAYWNSVLGGGMQGDLRRLLIAHGIDAQHAEEYESLLTWRAGTNAGLDVQYTPFLEVGTVVAHLHATHLASHLIRNIMMLARKRLFDDGRHDPVAARLAHAFGVAGYPFDQMRKYTFGAAKGDIDAIAMVGDTIVICECKNTLLPCSPNERRTFYDYMDKAVIQLERLRQLVLQPGFIEYLGKLLGWTIPRNPTVRYCIVPSIRLLSGANYDGYPVRHVDELGNLVESGKAVVKLENETLTFDLRGERPLSEVLGEYLSPDPPIYKAFWDATVTSYEVWGTSRWTVRVPKYGWDPSQTVDLMKNRFVYTSDADASAGKSCDECGPG
jgi:hypothetical protein